MRFLIKKCSRLRRGHFRYTTILYQSTLHKHFIQALYTSILTKHFTQALYPSTLHKHFNKALYTSTLHKHFNKALYTSTLSKHFIKALYQSTLHKHLIKALYQRTLSRYYKGITKVLQGYYKGITNVFVQVTYRGEVLRSITCLMMVTRWPVWTRRDTNYLTASRAWRRIRNRKLFQMPMRRHFKIPLKHWKRKRINYGGRSRSSSGMLRS